MNQSKINYRHANIYEVAELAQVSAMTVTRAFNGSAPVAPKTREKIMAAAEQLNYRPSLFARSLRGVSTRSVGILWSLAPPHSSVRQVRDISTRMYNHGYACHIADSLSDPKIVTQCLGEFVDRKVDGVVLQTMSHPELSPEIIMLLKKLPAALVVSSSPYDIPFDQLVIDRRQAVSDLLDHFIRSGKKRPVFFYNRNSAFSEIFLEEMSRRGLDTTQCLLSVEARAGNGGDYNWRAYAEYVAKHYPDEIPFDAIWLSTDECAAAMVQYLHERGLRVPEDIAVCGNNNSYMSEFFSPPLASISREEGGLADLVEEMLMARLDNPGLPPVVKTISTKFIPRRSAGVINL